MKQVSKDEYEKALKLLMAVFDGVNEIPTEISESGVTIHRTPDNEVYALAVYHRLVNTRGLPVEVSYYISHVSIESVVRIRELLTQV